MFPGQQEYREGQFPPKPGYDHDWHVWCSSGALLVLKKQGYVRKLADQPDDAYTINFANGSGALIQPGHPLWEAMAEIAQTYTVEVFPLDFFGCSYVPWTGAADDLRRFDAILIKKKTASIPA